MFRLLKLQVIALLLFCINSAQAVEFTHFKLKNNSLTTNRYGERSSMNIAKTSTPIMPILTELQGLLSNQYNALGEKEVKDLMENYDLGGGVLNFSGFTWYKPMLNYNIAANREVAPHLYSDMWIIHDNFTIQIDALTLLSKFKEQDIIDISDGQLQAFAGLSFIRRYHYYHFADSYLDGLSSDYSKLFMTFNKFKPKNISKLSPYEVIKKSDTFHFHSGAAVKVPTSVGTIGAGIAYSQTSKSEVKIHMLGSADKENKTDYLRLTVDKEKTKSAAAKLTLEYDFFNLLNLTLLSSEFEYEYKKSHASYLGFTQKQYNKEIMNTELSSLLKGQTEIETLKKYVVSLEEREREDYNSRFSFLLLGSMKKRAFEQIKIIRNNLEKTFFKSYSRSIYYIQNFISRVFSSIIRKIFDFETNISNISELEKELQIEFEEQKNLGAMTVDEMKKFSIRIEINFQIDKTHKWYHYTRFKKAKNYTEKFTLLDREIRRRISRKEIRGPLKSQAVFELGENAIKSLLLLGNDKAEDSIIDLCKLNSRERREVRKGATSSDSPRIRCYDRIAKKFIAFKSTYTQGNLINLKQLKSFLGSYLQKVTKLEQIQTLFGKNAYLHGSFSAKLKNGDNFQSFYSSGQFEGIGVIESFRTK